jgi:hypothetical protein
LRIGGGGGGDRNELVCDADWSRNVPVGRSDPVELYWGQILGTGSDITSSLVRFILKLRNFTDGTSFEPLERMIGGCTAFNDSFLSIKGTG